MTRNHRTVGAAVSAARSNPGNDTIFLRAGTFYQTATQVLGPADSGLTIQVSACRRNYPQLLLCTLPPLQAFPGEEAWISGAVPLTNLTWAPYNVNASAYWTTYNNTNAVFADVPGGAA